MDNGIVNSVLNKIAVDLQRAGISIQAKVLGDKKPSDSIEVPETKELHGPLEFQLQNMLVRYECLKKLEKINSCCGSNWKTDLIKNFATHIKRMPSIKAEILEDEITGEVREQVTEDKQ